MDVVVAVLAGYLLGCLPVATLVARHYGVDLHATGDGNPGAWNALEQLGARRAWPAFVGDGAEGVRAGRGRRTAPAASGSPSRRPPARCSGTRSRFRTPRRGGKAVMCFVGAAFALSPARRRGLRRARRDRHRHGGFAWGARVAVFAFPLVQLVTDPVAHVAATGVLMTFIGVLFIAP